MENKKDVFPRTDAERNYGYGYRYKKIIQALDDLTNIGYQLDNRGINESDRDILKELGECNKVLQLEIKRVKTQLDELK